jgi:hypothetical protein
VCLWPKKDGVCLLEQVLLIEWIRYIYYL